MKLALGLVTLLLGSSLYGSVSNKDVCIMKFNAGVLTPVSALCFKGYLYSILDVNRYITPGYQLGFTCDCNSGKVDDLEGSQDIN